MCQLCHLEHGPLMKHSRLASVNNRLLAFIAISTGTDSRHLKAYLWTSWASQLSSSQKTVKYFDKIQQQCSTSYGY